jgi:ATP-dependent DNA helicase RecQ
LRKDIERYGELKLTQLGLEYKEKPYPIKVAGDRNFSEDENELSEEIVPINSADTSTDPELYNILKSIRKKIAEKEKLPPYVIFEDRSLVDMCIQYPITEEELKNIIGVGASKAKKYGNDFLQAINAYVEAKDITRPQDLVIKSLINKSSGLKYFIIRNIDKKLPLEDIAQSKNLDLDELLTEIESIVSSGTKIDISYYINETIDPYHQEEISELLREMETDDIDEVLEELGEEEYSREEVRLMRIQFLTKYGH